MLLYNELRIGNILKDGDNFCVVSTLSASGQGTETRFGVMVVPFPDTEAHPPAERRPEGLLLTDDLMRKLGYEADVNNFYYIDAEVNLRLAKFSPLMYIPFVKDQQVGVGLNCLHHLQNLVFVLTGKEINLSMLMRR